MGEKKEIDELKISEEAKGQSDALKEASSADGLDAESDGSMIAVPAEAFPVNTPLPCTVYMKKGGKFLVYRRQAEKINYKTALENQKRNTESLYIHQAFWALFKKSLENLKVEKEASEIDKAMVMRHLLVAYGQELEKQIEEPKKPYFLNLQKKAEAISRLIFNDPSKGTKLLRNSNDAKLYFVNHSVNVAIYASLIGIKQGVSEKDLPLLTFAALVHDCGNLFLPRRLLYKSSEFTPDEELLMRQHPKKGAELLTTMGFPGKVVEAVAFHHEQIDGQGYPDGLKDKEIPFFAKIISIADVFDALTMTRPYRKAIPASEALEQMQNMAGKFDANMLQMLKEYKDPYAE